MTREIAHPADPVRILVQALHGALVGAVPLLITLVAHEVLTSLTSANVVLGFAQLAPRLNVAILGRMTETKALGANHPLEAPIGRVTQLSTCSALGRTARGSDVTNLAAGLALRNAAVFKCVTATIAPRADHAPFSGVTVLGTAFTPRSSAIYIHVSPTTACVAVDLGALANAV